MVDSLLKYEENLRSHPGYAKAALAAIDVYLRVNDDPSIIEEKLSASSHYFLREQPDAVVLSELQPPNKKLNAKKLLKRPKKLNKKPKRLLPPPARKRRNRLSLMMTLTDKSCSRARHCWTMR